VSNDPLHQLHIDWIIAFLAQHRLPGMFYAKENVAAGGFMAYGASVPDLFRRAAGYVHRIRKAPSPPTCRSSCRRSSISPSTSGPRGRSASTCRRCWSPAPTR
jgi:hypothetical protein